MIYLSGPITSKDPKKQRENLARFYFIEDQMDELCFNPARTENSEIKRYETYLIYDLMWITRHRPKLFMMRGWRESQGARLEHELALYLGLEITYEE